MKAFLNEAGHNIISISGSSNIKYIMKLILLWTASKHYGSLTKNFCGWLCNPKSLSSDTVLLSLNNQNTFFKYRLTENTFT